MVVPDPAVQVRVGLVSVEHVVLAHPHHQVARRDVLNRRLNMELDLQKFIWAPCAQLYSSAETPQLPPPSPRIWAHIRGRYWSAKIDDISL